MTTEFVFTYQEMEALADALAYLRMNPDKVIEKGHTVTEVSKLRQRIRTAMADYPEFTI